MVGNYSYSVEVVEVAQAIGIDEDICRKLFVPDEVENAGEIIAEIYGVPYDKVTPAMVADALLAAVTEQG